VKITNERWQYEAREGETESERDRQT